MIKKLLLPIFLLLVIFVNAQSLYNFETENVPYQNLLGGTSLNNVEEWDDPAYTIPLGFDFQIGSQVFNKFIL